jgi:hypothetical protein
MSVGDKLESIGKKRLYGILLEVFEEEIENENLCAFYMIELESGQIICEPHFYWRDSIPF